VLGLRTPPENMVHIDFSGLNGSKVKESHSGYSEHIFAHFSAVILDEVASVCPLSSTLVLGFPVGPSQAPSLVTVSGMMAEQLAA